MDYGITLSSSDSATTSKRKKNVCDTFKLQMKNIVYLLKHRMMNNLGTCKKFAFEMNPINSMLNQVVEILSLHQLEYEMERVDLPDDYNCFEIGYCGHPAFPYTHIQLEQETKLIFSHLQK